jgi:HEAT repeat protein
MRNDTGELLSLSGSAAAVWRLIDGLRDRRALLEALNSHFSAVPPIPSEIEEFLSELKEMGLIGHG